MIGNDIIDLNVAGLNSRWQEQRFLDKLFTHKEQEFILKDELRFQKIWRLWSMKESAYKISVRETESSSFNPKSFHCKITSDSSGMVLFGNHAIKTTTKYNTDMIYTTAKVKDTLQITDYFKLDNPSQPYQLKSKAIHAYSQLKSILESFISIEKDQMGVPHFFIDQTLQADALTLTHHGQYAGFAISCESIPNKLNHL